MRSIETLVRQYPEKTGAEILEICKKDQLEQEREYNLRNAKQLELIKDINKNGGYFKGTFGLNQSYFYRFFKLSLGKDGIINCEMEKIVIFENINDAEPFTLRFAHVKFAEFDNCIGMERTTKEKFEEVRDYFKNSIDKFW